MLSAFKDTPVLITGHTGFKGSWLALWLHRLGAKVSGFSHAATAAPYSNFSASGVREIIGHHIEGDVRDEAAVREAIRKVEPRVVFHLAAQPLMGQGLRAPAATFGVNVMGTVNVLDAIRSHGCPCVVVVATSDKCYDEPERAGGRQETDPVGGRDPYGASKAAAELVLGAYRRSFFPPEKLDEHRIAIASTRAGNAIGGGDWARSRLIVDLVTAIARGEPAIVRQPSCVRPWQHVLEPLAGYMQLAARLLRGPDDPALCSAWNFGPRLDDGLSVGELADLVCCTWGSGSWSEAPGSPNEVQPATRLNIRKALTLLGWRPRWTVEEAVRRTVRWYKTFYEAPQRDMQPYCLADIEAYERDWLESESKTARYSASARRPRLDAPQASLPR
jgi:CDP-glucose 4,6-dehydratase